MNERKKRPFRHVVGEHSTDGQHEPSAYEVLVVQKKEKADMESKRKRGKRMSNGEKDSRTAAKTSLIVGDEVALRSAGENVDEINMVENYAVKLARTKTRKGTGRKSKPTAKEWSYAAKAPSATHTDNNVFTSLLTGKYGASKEMHLLRKKNIPKNMAHKRGKKMKTKIVVDGKIVTYLDEGYEQQNDEAFIVPDSDEELLEAAVVNGEKKEDVEVDAEEGYEFDNVGGVWPLLADIGEEDQEKVENDVGSNNFVKCGRTDAEESVQSVVIDFEKKPFSEHGDSVRNGLDAFKWLIHPYDIKQFFKMVFQKKAFCVCRNNPRYYGNLFTTAKFIDILRTEYVEYGTNVNVALYKDQRRSTFNGVGKVYPWDIQRKIQTGCSIQFTNPQSFCDSVWYYCDLLQEVFGCFVGANTYMTPANTAGFAPHWDDIDAFLLQLEGRKHWKVYAPTNDDEMLPRLPSDNFTDDDMANRTPVFNGWLEQGDLLYIPRGFIHQGFADRDIHSHHLTVSVCRNVTYADLMEHVIPAALPNFAEQQKHIRKSLPIGHLDMTGVLERKYPLIKAETVKLHHVLDAAFSDFCNYIKELNESAIDMMAREFMKTALPPMLTKEEKDMTALCIAGSSLYDGNGHVFTKHTPIKLLRRHGQRLIYESEERCFIIHRMANSRVYDGRPEVFFDLDVELAKGFANLLDTYPRWCSVSNLKCDTTANSIRLAELLYNNGLIMAKFPK